MTNLAPGAPGEFVGRQVELEYINGALSNHARHAIWGEPGIGKSQLARQWAHQAVQRYDLRWWINASAASSVRAGLRELAASIGIESALMMGGSTDDSGAGEARFLVELARLLANPALDGRVLIVLDNVDGAEVKSAIGELALRYLPTKSCDVLVTSQNGE